MLAATQLPSNFLNQVTTISINGELLTSLAADQSYL